MPTHPQTYLYTFVHIWHAEVEACQALHSNSYHGACSLEWRKGSLSKVQIDKHHQCVSVQNLYLKCIKGTFACRDRKQTFYSWNFLKNITCGNKKKSNRRDKLCPLVISCYKNVINGRYNYFSFCMQDSVFCVHIFFTISILKYWAIYLSWYLLFLQPTIYTKPDRQTATTRPRCKQIWLYEPFLGNRLPYASW